MRLIALAALLLAGAARAADPNPSPGASPAAAISLDPLLLSGALWDAGSQSALPYARLGFHWNSASQDALQTTLPRLTLLGVPVTGVIVRFKPGAPKEAEVLFYDRGDNGELSKDAFEALRQRCEAAISAFSKTAPAAPARNSASAVKAEGEKWQVGKSQLVLEWSATREVKTRGVPFRSEFIRLELTPVEAPRTLLEEALSASAPGAPFSGPSHVIRSDSGDVRIDGIPMVDQGDKGYCVVASTERVLRYYGEKVDQNELAEIANTSAKKGTNNSEMFDALKKLTARLHIRTKVEEALDSRTLLSLFNEYNRVAKRKKADGLDIYAQDSDMESVYHQMNFDILREVRTRNRTDMDRFQKLVKAHVDAGIPVLWSVVVGLAPENPPIHGFGGHMRLVIGYNEKTSEILYSDSWGAGHELKRMAAADAWAITTAVSTVEPL